MASGAALSEALNETVKASFLLRSSLVQEEAVFLVLTTANIHVVDLDLAGPRGRGGVHLQSPLSSLNNVDVNETDNDSFTLQCGDGDLRSASFTSAGRDDVLKELQVLWRACTMVTDFEVRPFPISSSKALSTKRKAGTAAFTRPPDEERKHTYKGYFFFLPSSFATFPPGSPVFTGKFSSAKGGKRWRKEEFAEFAVMPTISIQSQAKSKQPAPKDAAELVLHYKGSIVDSYKLMATKPMFKRLNLNSDPAQWTGWIIHMRTGLPSSVSKAAQFVSLRDIAIISMQRAFIPPAMGDVQGITVVFYGRQNHYESSASFLERAQSIADSVTPSDVPAIDYAVCRARANALQLTDAGFSWYRAQLRITPSCERYAQQIVKSTLLILYSARIVTVEVDTLFPEAEVRMERDPLFYASLLERDMNGVDAVDDVTVMERWRVRVWRYIAWAIDGGLLPSILNLQLVFVAIKTLPTSRSDRQALERLVDTMLHLRGEGKPFVWLPLRQQVTNAELMQAFELNERVMVSMLESGVAESELAESRDAAEYPRFLARLLRRKRSYVGGMLASVVCKQILSVSTNGVGAPGSRQAEPTLNILIPALVDQLKSTVDNVKVLAMASLVNYSRNNNAVKSKIMAAGGVRAAIQHLSSKNLDLARHSCALVEVCSKSEEKRRTIGSLGGIPVLVRLTQRDPNPPYFRSIPLLVQALSALGYLATEGSLRDAITTSMGFTAETAPDGSIERPNIIRHLTTLLTDKELTAEDGLRAAILEKVLILTKNLCLKEKDNKRAAGELFVPYIVEIIKEGTESQQVISAALQCAFVLILARINCILFERYKFSDLLKRYRTGAFSKVITEFAQQITGQISSLAGEMA